MIRKLSLTLLSLLIVPVLALAEEGWLSSLDKAVNDKVEPIAVWWEGFVLSSFTIAGVDIPLVLVILIGGASFFTFYFGFVNIRKIPFAIQVVRGKFDFVEKQGAEDFKPDDDVLTREGDIPDTVRDESRDGEVNHFQALTAAVSATVGLGNIAGVAIAIGIGGPGATFWMIIAGFLGMSSKFVECTLGVKYRDIDSDGTVHGGPMYYLSKGFIKRNWPKFGKFLAVVFAILCIGASFGGGNMFQANQSAAQFMKEFNVQSGYAGAVFGLFLATLVGIVIIGGIKRIGKVTERVVPFMAGIYVLAALIIIGANYQDIPRAFSMILEQAFNPIAIAGGLIGVIVTGFQRAAFSNEAGIGSASIAHSAVKTKFAASEGVVALLEPFIDTVVICTLTALVIIFFNMDGAFVYGSLEGNQVIITETGERLGGVNLTSAAFDDVIPGFSVVLTIAVILFAFSSMLSWSYYGLQAWKYLFGKSRNVDLAYKVLFLFFIVIGAAASLGAVIKFSDAMILAMVFPNMIGLLFLVKDVREEMNKYLSAISNRFGKG
ncbi:MAG: amino acid carrier protein [Bacteroidetes bacterium]|jgi:AGCS family alanine or glycine:cation symporter|nr:amino acid carrier protein [Bacteroidota bacterium]